MAQNSRNNQINTDENQPLIILKKIVRVLKFAGAFELNGERDYLYYLRYVVKRWTFAFVLTNAFLTHNVSIYINHRNLLIVCEDCIWIFVALMMLSKVGVMFNTKTITKLVHTMERIHARKHFKDDYEKELLQKTQIICDKLSLLGPTVYPGFATLFNILSVPKVVGQRALTVSGWYPYMQKEFPYFEISLSCWIFLVTSMYFLTALSDTLLIVLLIRTRTQFNVLNHNLRNIRTRSILLTYLDNRDLEDGPNNNHLTSLQLLKPVSKKNPVNAWKAGRTENLRSYRFTKNTNFVHFKVRKVKQISTPGMCVSSWNNGSWKEELNAEMLKQLAACVDHHQDLISFVNDLEAAFNPVLVVQLACNLMVTGVIGIYTTLVPSMDEKGWALVQMLMVVIVQLFMFCRLSDQVTEESSAVKEAIYASEWLDASDSFKRSMRVIISRANQPVIITTARYIPLSMETFYRITKTAYSNYMMLRTFMEGKIHHLNHVSEDKFDY